MNAFLRLGDGVFEWVLETTWQAAVLAGMILLAQWLFRKRLSPAWRYGFWMLLLVRLMMPTLPESAFSVFNWVKLEPPTHAGNTLPTEPVATPESPVSPKKVGWASETTSSSATVTEPSGPAVTFGGKQAAALDPQPSGRELAAVNVSTKGRMNWFRAGMWLWLAGVGVLGLRFGWTNLRFLARLRQCVPVKEENILRLFDACRASLGFRHSVILIETESVQTPAVYGLWRKRLLLPNGIFERFCENELRYIFLHELAHFKRRDLEVNWLAALLQLLHWFNPVLWFAFARMRADRELATDLLVLKRSGESERSAYGGTILKLLEDINFKHPVPRLVGIAESKSQIKSRVLAISHYGLRKHWRSVAIGMAIAIAGLALTAATDQEDDSETSPENNRQFAIRVLDYDTSEPVSGITVRFDLEYYDGRTKTQSDTTNAEGIASVEFDPNDLKRFFYKTDNEDYLALEGEWLKQQAAHLPELFEIKVRKGELIGGVVVDESNNPIPNAEIFINAGYRYLIGATQPDYAQTWRAVAGKRLAVTDSNGRWNTRDFWPHSFVTLRIRHPDYADAVFSTRITKAMEAEKKGHSIDREALNKQNMRFILTPGFSIAGQVVNETGIPMPNIQVRKGEVTEGFGVLPEHHWERIALTDSEGRFQFDHVSERQHYFAAQEQGYAPAVTTWTSLSAPSSLEIRMTHGGLASGRVIDDEGQPVEDVKISMKDWSIWRGVEWSTRTDEKGEFEWVNAPGDPFRVRFEKTGYIHQERNLQGGNSREITLQPTLKIVGKISDAQTKLPVEDFKIAWSSSLADVWEQNPKIDFSDPGGGYTLDLEKIQSEYWLHGYPHEFIFRVEAEGYAPKTSRGFSRREGDVGTLEYDFELEPANVIVGTIVDADGNSVEGVQVALNSPWQRVIIDGTPQFSHLDSDAYVVTDAQGRFSISDSYDPDSESIADSDFPRGDEAEVRYLIAVHKKGIAWVPMDDVSPDTPIALQAWAGMEGTALQYDQSLDEIGITVDAHIVGSFQDSEIRTWQKTVTDANGRFSFEFLPPTKARIYRMIPMPNGGASSLGKTVYLNSGETSVVQFGGEGRPVIGKMEIANYYLPIDWTTDLEFHSIHTPYPKRPENLTTREEYNAWRRSEEVRKLYDNMKRYPMVFNEDGLFRIGEVAPGEYQFDLRLFDPTDPDARAYGNYLASFNGSFEVPDGENANSREPYDVGTFQIEIKRPVAPDFTAEDLEGNEFKLSDFKGKYVFLDFWATWCAPCIADLPYLRNAHKKYHDRENFVMLSLSFDDTVEKVQRFIDRNNIQWDQGFLGPSAQSDIPGYYKRGIPAMFVIDPEGNVVSENFEGTDIERTLSRILDKEAF